MNYRRVLLLTEIGADVRAALAAARALAPGAERLVVAACPPATEAGRPGGGPDTTTPAWLDGVRAAAGAAAAQAEVGIVPDLEPVGLDALVASTEAELVVAGPRPVAAIRALAELRRRYPVAVLWIPSAAAARGGRPVATLLCMALGGRARGAIAAFLRDHGDPTVHVTVLSFERPPPDELASRLDVAGIQLPIALARREGVPPWRALVDVVRERAIDLVVLTRFAPPVVRSNRWPAPVLVLPLATPARRPVRLPLDVADAVDLGGTIRVRLGAVHGIGRNPPIPDHEVAFISSGRVVATVRTHDGEAELPAALVGDTLGVLRVAGDAAEPVAAIERFLAVVHPGPQPLVLFDAELPSTELATLASARTAELLAVRMRPVLSIQRVRARLRGLGLDPRVVDASAILDEGDAADVSDALDGVRLARVALRMIAAGFPVVAIVHRGPQAPATRGFAALRPGEVAMGAWERPSVVRRPPESLAERLDLVTDATGMDGNRIEVELDNSTARLWLLDAISRAERTVHLQTYMAADDDVGREIEAALRDAAARSVTVRVIADSLHGLHGSFGLRNPLLERLSAIPGAEVRVWRPVAGFPSLEDLKQRDHRKLCVADGRVALLGGRNLAHEYYRAFDEVPVSSTTPWRMVPWLDAGARVEGPAVAALERSFHEAWTETGGVPFDVGEPAPAGATPARVVVHRGLRDAAALEAYLAIIDTARFRVDAVNGFPLVLEIQHALLRALRRGVRVRTLFGHVTPTHGGEPFEGEWATVGTAATWMVHSRMDALVAAGAEAYQLALRDVPGWAPDLGLVHPHVHAKAMGADGRVCAVGSANLDLTGSYWESELLLVVEDEAVARAFEDRVSSLMAHSVRVDRDDPEWQRVARRRSWMRRWPGVLSL